jgi:membrane-bound serine protease (ClpP class)
VRFLPHGWVWDKLVLGTVVTGNSQRAGAAAAVPARDAADLIGREGVAATDLRPNGQVEIDGRRYEASVEIGAIDAGRPVRVVGRNSFVLLVAEGKS